MYIALVQTLVAVVGFDDALREKIFCCVSPQTKTGTSTAGIPSTAGGTTGPILMTLEMVIETQHDAEELVFFERERAWENEKRESQSNSAESNKYSF